MTYRRISQPGRLVAEPVTISRRPEPTRRAIVFVPQGTEGEVERWLSTTARACVQGGLDPVGITRVWETARAAVVEGTADVVVVADRGHAADRAIADSAERISQRWRTGQWRQRRKEEGRRWASR